MNEIQQYTTHTCKIHLPQCFFHLDPSVNFPTTALSKFTTVLKHFLTWISTYRGSKFGRNSGPPIKFQNKSFGWNFLKKQKFLTRIFIGRIKIVIRIRLLDRKGLVPDRFGSKRYWRGLKYSWTMWKTAFGIINGFHLEFYIPISKDHNCKTRTD